MQQAALGAPGFAGGGGRRADVATAGRRFHLAASRGAPASRLQELFDALRDCAVEKCELVDHAAPRTNQSTMGQPRRVAAGGLGWRLGCLRGTPATLVGEETPELRLVIANLQELSDQRRPQRRFALDQ